MPEFVSSWWIVGSWNLSETNGDIILMSQIIWNIKMIITLSITPRTNSCRACQMLLWFMYSHLLAWPEAWQSFIPIRSVRHIVYKLSLNAFLHFIRWNLTGYPILDNSSPVIIPHQRVSCFYWSLLLQHLFATSTSPTPTSSAVTRFEFWLQRQQQTSSPNQSQP